MARCVCIICGTEVDNLSPDGYQPGDGLAFQTFGHYGSAKFDPMDGSILAITICDSCLDARRDRVLHGTAKWGRSNIAPYDYQPWTDNDR